MPGVSFELTHRFVSALQFRSLAFLVLLLAASTPGMAQVGEPGELLPPGRNLPTLDLKLEAIEPFVSVSRSAPPSIDVPRDVTITFRAEASSSRPFTLTWTGAKEINTVHGVSSARRTFKISGVYTVAVTADSSVGKRTRSIRINVGAVAARQVKIVMIDPPAGAREAGRAGKAWPCKAGINYPQYAHLIQWSAPDGEPAIGVGPAPFTPIFKNIGLHELIVGPGSGPGRGERALIQTYGVTRISYQSAGRSDFWYDLPVTFTAQTTPPGYGSKVDWKVDTHMDMLTHAEPVVGHGETFTTTFHSMVDWKLFWAQVYADDFTALASPDQTPPLPPCRCGQVLTPAVEQVSKRIEEQGAGDPKDGDAVTGVLLGPGQLYLRGVDLVIPGRGMDFRFQRAYRSRVRYDGPLGTNWDFTYNMRLMDELNINGTPTGNLYFFNGLGRRDLFIRLLDGTYLSPAGYYDQLSKDATTGAFTLRERDGTVYAFGAINPSIHRASLLSITDRNLNHQLLSYDANGNLIQVLDTLSRPILFNYRTDGHLDRITDFTQRTVIFGYDLNGDLISVTSPVVPTGSTPNGNDFPIGKTIRYAYTTGMANADLNHNLVSITRPNEVAVGGPPAVINTYGTDPNKPEELDRVITQVRGGLNAAAASRGIPAAGGTFNLFYQTLNPMGNPADLTLPRSRTTIVEWVGNVAVYEQNVQAGTLSYKEYTGRVNPALSRTTLLGLIPANNPSFPPIAKLRSSDPAFFETLFAFNIDGEMTRTTYPEGNRTEFTFDVLNADRFQQGNLTQIRRVPDSARGGDQTEIRTTLSYEPIYNQVRTLCDPRGNDSTFVPPVDPNSAGCSRFASSATFDYEEACNFASIATRAGRTPAETQSLLTAAGICATPLADVNGDGLTNQISGNLVRTSRPTVHLIAGSNQSLIEGTTLQPILELSGYNQFGQLVKLVDSEANVDEYSYFSERDPDGDGQDINPALNSVTGGYLKQVTRDSTSSPSRDSGTNPTPTSIRHQYFYDRLGNITRKIDGRGIETRYSVNTLNQIVQTSRAFAHNVLTPDPPEPMALIDFRFLKSTAFDFNNNVVHRQIEDCGNTSDTSGFVDFTSSFDILDRKIEDTKEVSVSQTLVTSSRYDASENGVNLIEPEGNFHTTTHDERDQVFQMTRGAGGPFGGAPATSTNHYDRNRGLVEKVDAADTDGSAANNSTMGGTGDRTRTVFDGFDRQTSIVDSVGNQSVTQYDPAGNAVRVSRFGPIGGPSPTNDGPASLGRPVSSGGMIQNGNLVSSNLMEAIQALFDEMNRPIQINRALFVNTGNTVRAPDVADGATDIGKGDLTPGDTCSIAGVQTPPTGYLGCVTTRKEFDRNSRLTFTVQDDLDTARQFYDGAGRVLKRQDPEGNTVEMAYDDGDNVIEVRETDASQLPGVPSEVFLTTSFFDSLNRIQRSVDNLGQTTDFRYDSRGNLVAMADAEGPPGPMILRRAFPSGALTANATNLYGNVTLSFYDGISRSIKQEIVLTASGQGDGANIGATLEGVKSTTPSPDPSQSSDGLITTLHGWDGDSREIATTDDNGNQTQRNFDNLNRQLTETKGICTPPLLADRCDPATTIGYEYDSDNNLTRVTDEAGSVTDCAFDATNRRKSCLVTRAPGVIGTTATSTEWDGLSRITLGTDNNDPADPNDDSFIAFAYDSLGRVIEETQQIGLLPAKAISAAWRAENLRIGVTYPNNRRVNSIFDHLDRLNIVADQGVATPIADYDFIGQSRVAQRLFPQNGTRMTYVDNSETVDSGYDGLRRPIELRHLRSDDSLIVGFSHTYDRMNNKNIEEKLHSPSDSELYDYDSASRLLSLQRGLLNSTKDAITTPSPNVPIHGAWVLDGVGNWRQVDSEIRQHSSFNEIIGRNTPSVIVVLSDDNGNVTDDGTYTLKWDAQNRLRTVTRKTTGLLVGTYSYDVENRRTKSVVTNSGALNGSTAFYLDGPREVEERNASDVVTRQYVYGMYVDEPLSLDKNLDGDSTAIGPGDQRLFYHVNSLFSVFAMTTTAGTVAEGYQYDAYGSQTVFSPGPNGLVDFGGDDTIASDSPGLVGNSFMYTGRRFDPETGRYYFRTRYLEPKTGRFSSRDVVGTWADQHNYGNAYAYLGDGPMGGTDPFGLMHQCGDRFSLTGVWAECVRRCVGDNCLAIQFLAMGSVQGLALLSCPFWCPAEQEGLLMPSTKCVPWGCMAQGLVDIIKGAEFKPHFFIASSQGWFHCKQLPDIDSPWRPSPRLVPDEEGEGWRIRWPRFQLRRGYSLQPQTGAALTTGTLILGAIIIIILIPVGA